MTNPTPDAALLWARAQIAGLVERNNEAAAVMRGESREDEVDVLAEAFRAGQSHAAGPLKALEAIVAQSRVGDGSKPVTFSGRVNYPAPLLFAVRAAIAAAKGGRDAG
jgi:hypothetical protein